MAQRKLRIAICHPDLGIGGAERLIVDAALELKACGHDVHVFTAHHDPKRCFEETRDGSFPVTVYGSFICRNIFNKFNALFAYIRCIFVAICMILLWPRFDVVLVDQVSAVIPFLKLKSSKIVFYCHFPDLLLAEHTTELKKLYRKPLDWIEEATTGLADRILVNSDFTAQTFARTFESLDERGIRPDVLYPAVDLQEFFDLPRHTSLDGISSDTDIILSINRFERKKNVALAVSAFALAARQLEDSGHTRDIKLVLAGGYDPRLQENREVMQELRDLAGDLRISQHVIFLPSCSTQQRNELLGACTCVVYTPSEEHFGIVPLEAMAAGKPVIACNSGGPKESIVHEKTGFLCHASPSDFGFSILEFVHKPGLAERMGQDAKQHVQDKFSRQAFGRRLANIIDSVCGP